MQRLFEFSADAGEIRIGSGMAKPLIAALQHVRDETFSGREIVIQMEKQEGDGRMVLLDVAERIASRLTIQIVRFFGNLRHGAEAGEPRHPAGYGSAQGVDGLDAHLRGIPEQAPILTPIVFEHPTGDIEGHKLMGSLRRDASFGAAQSFEDAPAHFAGGLAREGDGNNGVRPIHGFEQLQVALDQQLRFSRTGRGLHNERYRGIERTAARGTIGCHFRIPGSGTER